MPKGADAIIGGWRVTGVISLRSGLPYFVISGQDNENTGHLLGFLLEPANEVSDPQPASFTPTRQHGFDPNAFAVPALGTMGNISKDKYVGPSFQNVDLAPEKDFSIRES